MQGKKGSKRIEMIIKMVNEFKLTIVHFARPNPMQICACAWISLWTKKLWKIRSGPLGLQAMGREPPGCRGPAFSKTPTFWVMSLVRIYPGRASSMALESEALLFTGIKGVMKTKTLEN